MGEFIRQGLHATVNNHGDFKIHAPHSSMAWSRDTALELAQFINANYFDLDFPGGVADRAALTQEEVVKPATKRRPGRPRKTDA